MSKTITKPLNANAFATKLAKLREACVGVSKNRDALKLWQTERKGIAMEAGKALVHVGIPSGQFALIAESPKMFVRAAFKQGAPEGRQATDKNLKAHALFASWAAKPAATPFMIALCASASITSAEQSSEEWNGARQTFGLIMRAIIEAVTNRPAKSTAQKVSDLAARFAKLAKENKVTEADVIKAVKDAFKTAEAGE